MNSSVLLWVIILIVGEIIFFGILAFIYFIYNKKPTASSSVPPVPPVQATIPVTPPKPDSDSLYWEQEIDRTKTTLLSRNENALGDYQNIDLLSLNLRLEMLQLEQKTSLTESDKRKIETIELDIRELLQRMQIIHAIDALNKKENVHDDGTKILIEKQNQTIEFLKKYSREILDTILKQNGDFLSSKQGPEDVAKLSEAHNAMLENSESLLKKIDELEFQNKELNLCVEVLEDENLFLRDQISSLLKLSNE